MFLRKARPMTQTIQSVSDTAFMVAGCRAAESERPKPLFRDPLAAKLVGDRGEKILATVPGRLWHKVAAHRTSVGHRRADALPQPNMSANDPSRT